jgi:hypothetical protein
MTTNTYFLTIRSLEALQPFKDLISEYEGDDTLLSDMIEGETSVLDAFDILLKKTIENDILITGIDEYKNQLNARKSRLELQNEVIKAAMGRIFGETGVKKLQRPLGTLSFRKSSATLELDGDAQNEDGTFNLPSDFVKTVYSPMRRELLAALKTGEVIDHCSIKEGEERFSMTL